MRILCDQVDKMIEHTATKMEEGKLDIVSTLEIKVIACETVLKIADLCLKVGGGYAYPSNSPLERLIRDSKAGMVMGPTPEILKELIGKYNLYIPTQL